MLWVLKKSLKEMVYLSTQNKCFKFEQYENIHNISLSGLIEVEANATSLFIYFCVPADCLYL